MGSKPKQIITQKLEYFNDRGRDLKAYSLIMAVYYENLQLTQSILKSEPDQINSQEPYADMSPIHVAIFRQNLEIVETLLKVPNIKLHQKDNFGREPIDMLDYTINQAIFESVLAATYPNEMNDLVVQISEETESDLKIIPFRTKDN